MKHLGCILVLKKKKNSVNKCDLIKLSFNVFAYSNIVNTIEKQDEANSIMAERASAAAGAYIYKTGAIIIYEV